MNDPIDNDILEFIKKHEGCFRDEEATSADKTHELPESEARSLGRLGSLPGSSVTKLLRAWKKEATQMKRWAEEIEEMGYDAPAASIRANGIAISKCAKELAAELDRAMQRQPEENVADVGRAGNGGKQQSQP